ncbi:hypothetical protein [Azohydromonas lata]|uniref:Uncharacterized protein n=1 Tax=Azohydromonas lata TaxID=45677 RepID=A0ABU5IDQ7_9BURK|nr:hypothetical protein [Azohydromonas lata]MDZ5456681.1 hypothetical protein [Azohydromonas lata]
MHRLETSFARRYEERLELAQAVGRLRAANGDKGLTLLVKAAGAAADAPVMSQRCNVERLELAALVGAVGAFEQRISRLAISGTVLGGVLRHGCYVNASTRTVQQQRSNLRTG